MPLCYDQYIFSQKKNSVEFYLVFVLFQLRVPHQLRQGPRGRAGDAALDRQFREGHHRRGGPKHQALTEKKTGS